MEKRQPISTTLADDGTSANPRAIIVAAGRGSRFGADMPKQFCDLGGRPMLMTTIDRFVQAIGSESITVVLDKSMVDKWLQMCAKHGFSSPRIAEGGATRWQSVKNAIDSLDCPPRTVVMIHDGARPLVSVAMIKRLASLDEHYSGVIPTTKLTDSIRQLLPEARHRSEPRDKYVAVQTPQAFRAQALKNAYALPYDPAFTDDASVIEASHAAPIALADGESTNIKVTNPLDLVIAEAILAHQTADGSPISPSAPKATR